MHASLAYTSTRLLDSEITRALEFAGNLAAGEEVE
jgi:hypothetical protein